LGLRRRGVSALRGSALQHGRDGCSAPQAARNGFAV
jgi:hypothetical protein